MISLGHVLAFLAVAIAFFGGGTGSSIAVARAGAAVAGVSAEDPKKYGKVTLLQFLPATQGIYGFVIAIIILVKIGVLGSGLIDVSTEMGMSLIAAALPVSLVGFFSAIHQGKAAVAAINMVGRNTEMAGGRALIIVAIVELYAIFGLLASILIIMMGL